MPFKSSGRGAYGPQGHRLVKGPLAPVWVNFSPPAGGAAAYSYQFLATDDSLDAPTYSILSGSIPTGLTFSSSGLLSGTCSASGTFTFNVRATDVNGRTADTGNISVVVTLSIYTFTNATFTPGGATGQTGPNITQARSGVTGTPAPSGWTGTYLNMTTNGIQRWTVPSGGSYRIDAYGAQGGNGGATGGLGARIMGDFTLTTGEVIQILVGQQGQTGTHSQGGSNAGGGGGTFVIRADNSILLIAGGGGGGYGLSYGVANGISASATTTGNNGAGGIAGGAGGAAGGASNGNSSAGWNANGSDSNGAGNTAFRFLEGGRGGKHMTSWGDFNIWGGFGGGAGGGLPAGGGGGYSGGGGGTWDTPGAAGGGGSINNGTNQTNTAAARSGQGQVIITKL